jgi:hypothetical protein
MVVLAIGLALWEIQIEGKDGWAAKLPCWRVTDKWVMKLMGGRPLTGYHFHMVTFLIVILHFPVVFTEWNIQKELLVWGFLSGLLLLEDFFWFVLNPHYGLSRFRKGQIPWHKHWWGPFPDFYWWYAISATLLIFFGKQGVV